jgi:hypothetical protein
VSPERQGEGIGQGDGKKREGDIESDVRIIKEERKGRCE